MIRIVNFFSLFLIGGIVSAQIFIEPCDPCTLTPLTVYQVMTGKQCTLQVSSDTNDLWSGGLFLSGQDRDMGILRGKTQDPNCRDWKENHLDAAGPMARVYGWNDSQISGFDFYNSEYDRREGTWFLIDYQAVKPGECTIEFYDHSISWTQADPNIMLIIENIPNVDFYADNAVDLKDFMILASHWLNEDCADPDWCQQTDINTDGAVDVADLSVFASYWLWGIAQQPSEPGAEPNTPGTPVEPNEPSVEPNEPPAEPNEPQIPIDPNVIYAIHDFNGLDEITLQVGQSIRLYISKENINEDIYWFYLDVFISDPNSGWIDNREYDPSDPNDPAKADILAQPRDSFFDYFGPGYTQYEGIQLAGFSFANPMWDGFIASFTYTAVRPGDVILIPYNYDSFAAQLEPIRIHQAAP